MNHWEDIEAKPEALPEAELEIQSEGKPEARPELKWELKLSQARESELLIFRGWPRLTS
jgi:hypothetical protein